MAAGLAAGLLLAAGPRQLLQLHLTHSQQQAAGSMPAYIIAHGAHGTST